MWESHKSGSVRGIKPKKGGYSVYSTNRDGRLRVKTPGVDLVVAGAHIFPGTNIGWYKKVVFSRREKLKIYRNWFRWISKVIKRAEIDILAHPGMRIAQNGIIESFSGNVLDDLGELFTLAAANGVAVELNEACALKMTPEEENTYHHVIGLALKAGRIENIHRLRRPLSGADRKKRLVSENYRQSRSGKKRPVQTQKAALTGPRHAC